MFLTVIFFLSLMQFSLVYTYKKFQAASRSGKVAPGSQQEYYYCMKVFFVFYSYIIQQFNECVCLAIFGFTLIVPPTLFYYIPAINTANFTPLSASTDFTTNKICFSITLYISRDESEKVLYIHLDVFRSHPSLCKSECSHMCNDVVIDL